MNLLLIIQYTLVSIIMIVTIHYIWSFLKTNLTIPKTKDLVKKPTELYKDIYSTMNNTDSNKKEDMKNELRNYIGTLKDDKNNQNAKKLDVGSTKIFDHIYVERSKNVIKNLQNLLI